MAHHILRNLCIDVYRGTIQLYLLYLIIYRTLFRRGHSITGRKAKWGESEVTLLGFLYFLSPLSQRNLDSSETA